MSSKVLLDLMNLDLYDNQELSQQELLQSTHRKYKTKSQKINEIITEETIIDDYESLLNAHPHYIKILNLIPTKDIFRITTCILLLDLCYEWPKFKKISIDKKSSIIARIERSCYNNTIIECKRDGIDRFWENSIFKNRYSAMCSRITSNLYKEGIVNTHVSNPSYLIDKILSEDFNLDNIATLSSYELNPQCNENEIKEINERKSIKVNIKVSSRKMCPICHERKTTFIESNHTRAADEASTTTYSCTHCGHQWR